MIMKYKGSLSKKGFPSLLHSPVRGSYELVAIPGFLHRWKRPWKCSPSLRDSRKLSDVPKKFALKVFNPSFCSEIGQ